MPKTRLTTKQLGSSKDGHVLGEKTFAAITAVEGLSLSQASRQRLASLKNRNLTADEKRSEVIRAYVQAKSR